MTERCFKVEDVQIGVAGTLVSGADQIDQWKHEIDVIVTLVRGQVSFIDLLGDIAHRKDLDRVVKFEHPRGCWEMEPAGNKWQFRYWSKSRVESNSLLIYTGEALPAYYVEEVRDALDWLLAGLRKHARDFDRLIKPYISAAPQMGKQ